MRFLPERGGRSRIEDGYVIGVPELVVEISSSSAANDLRAKLESYRLYGVTEYILWLTDRSEILWLHLIAGEYRALPVDPDGIIRSRVFPGLWLDVQAMLDRNHRAIKAALDLGLQSPEHAAFIA